jgi:hypothetical protein
MAPDEADSGCCERGEACVFAKALLARAAGCELARRTCVGEAEVLACGSPVARINCATLAALLHERARFALHLPPPGRPLMHVQALRLQCGGLTALRQALALPDPDVHRLVNEAQHRYGSLADLPWADVVPVLAGWKPPRRGRRGVSPD